MNRTVYSIGSNGMTFLAVSLAFFIYSASSHLFFFFPVILAVGSMRFDPNRQKIKHHLINPVQYIPHIFSQNSTCPFKTKYFQQRFQRQHFVLHMTPWSPVPNDQVSPEKMEVLLGFQKQYFLGAPATIQQFPLSGLHRQSTNSEICLLAAF